MNNLNALKRAVHAAFKKRFGNEVCEHSHKFLRDCVGKFHVADCTREELQEVLFRVSRIKKVRNSIWARIERERSQKGVK